MTPVLRVKFGLLAIASLFAAAVAWNAAQGQIRPPVVRPPIGPRPINPPGAPQPIIPPGMPQPNNPPGMNPGGFPRTGPLFENVWTCGKCGRELGRGLSAPPDHCPHCGARIINGVGNGIPQPGMNPPVVNSNPPAFNPNPPVVNPGTNDKGPANLSSNDSSSASSSSGGLSKGKIAAIVIGIIVVGVFVLVGGTWLMIYTMKSSEPQPRRRRRRRRDEDHDD